VAEFPDLADGNPYPLGLEIRATTLLRSPLWNHSLWESNDLYPLGSEDMRYQRYPKLTYG